jgi:hypothetical protein
MNLVIDYEFTYKGKTLEDEYYTSAICHEFSLDIIELSERLEVETNYLTDSKPTDVLEFLNKKGFTFKYCDLREF